MLESRLTREAARSRDLLVDTLLALHALDANSVGLGDFGRPDGFLERQVPLVEAVGASETEPRPASCAGVVETRCHRSSAPASSTATTGSPTSSTVDVDHIAAVVDWEMATLGDPLADVGLLVVYQELSNAGGFVMPTLSVDNAASSPRRHGRAVRRRIAARPVASCRGTSRSGTSSSPSSLRGSTTASCRARLWVGLRPGRSARSPSDPVEAGCAGNDRRRDGLSRR